ncbi:MAG TPA: hypothetical protein VFS43_17750 [Polyangiaceae bacterium]|nr:hypothetical protein [Polyangiaceae bacterium]
MPKLLYATSGVQGTTGGLLVGGGGADCRSDTVDLARHCFPRANAAGTLSVVYSEDRSNGGAGTPVTVYLAQGQVFEGLVRRIRVAGTTVAPADLVLNYADP